MNNGGWKPSVSRDFYLNKWTNPKDLHRNYSLFIFHYSFAVYRSATDKLQFEFFSYSSISGLRTILGSVNTSVSSVLWVENSEITAPLGPPTNQWRVPGMRVYC